MKSHLKSVSSRCMFTLHTKSILCENNPGEIHTYHSVSKIHSHNANSNSIHSTPYQTNTEVSVLIVLVWVFCKILFA